MKANPIVLHEQSNSFGHGNKGREGERLVKNHGPFHLLTPVNGGTPWIRWHRGEEKHDRESNYKLEEFNLIEGVRPPPHPQAKLHKAWSKSGAATMRTLSFRNEHLPIRRTIRHPFLAAGLLFFIPTTAHYFFLFFPSFDSRTFPEVNYAKGKLIEEI